MNAITIRDLCFQYEAAAENEALKHICLEIKRGECLVLTGESGCGKTTLTRCINGLIPDFFEGTLSGEIRYEGRLVSELPQYELSAHIGTVFQDPRSQFFTVNSTDEVAFGCENLAFSTEKINQNVDRAFSRLHIEHLRDRSLFALSSGEKQRLAVASIYAMDSDVMILDEPTANLDRETIEILKGMLLSLKAEGKTLILSEHRLSWLTGLADRYVYLKNGEIAETWEAEAAVQISPERLHSYGLRAMREVALQLKKEPPGEESNTLSGAGISFAYGKDTIVDQLDFCFRWGKSGKIIGILGENGSGKTTFAKMLCGLLKPKAGQLMLNGRNWKQREQIKRTYFVMQDSDYQLFTESVGSELRLAAQKNKREKSPLADKIIKDILDNFELSAFAERHPLALSGGQKQRVTIGAALAADPDILVLDEPTSGLDGRNMQRLRDTLCDLQQQGKLIFIVTHDMEFLSGLANETITFSKEEEKHE